MLRDFPLEADRHLLLMRTSQLLILTSSCAVVIMPVATRCRLPTIHVNIGYNKLLSQSAETITDEIKEEKQTPERKRERPEENYGLHSLTQRKYSFPAGHTSHSALHACSTSTWKEAEAAEQERGSHIPAGVLNTTDQNSQTEHGEATRRRNALGNSEICSHYPVTHNAAHCRLKRSLSLVFIDEISYIGLQLAQ